MKRFFDIIADLFHKIRANKLRRGISMLLACAIVFITTYQLILPAITMEIDSAVETPGIYLEEPMSSENAAGSGAEDSGIVIAQEEPYEIVAVSDYISDDSSVPADPVTVTDGYGITVSGEETDYAVSSRDNSADADSSRDSIANADDIIVPSSEDADDMAVSWDDDGDAIALSDTDPDDAFLETILLTDDNDMPDASENGFDEGIYTLSASVGETTLTLDLADPVSAKAELALYEAETKLAQTAHVSAAYKKYFSDDDYDDIYERIRREYPDWSVTYVNLYAADLSEAASNAFLTLDFGSFPLPVPEKLIVLEKECQS